MTQKRLRPFLLAPHALVLLNNTCLEASFIRYAAASVMKISYCEVCNARVSPEDTSLGAEPYDDTRTIHYCEKHRPVIPATRPKGSSNSNLRAVGSNPRLKALGSGFNPKPGSSSNPNLKAAGSGFNARPNAGGSGVKAAGSGMSPRPRSNTPGGVPRLAPKSGAPAPNSASNHQLRAQKQPGAPQASQGSRRNPNRRSYSGDVVMWVLVMLALVAAIAFFGFGGKSKAPATMEKSQPLKAPESPENKL